MKFKINKYFGLIFCCILATNYLNAQDQAKHEISIWGSTGLSTLIYDTSVGDNKAGMGGAFGFGYNYFISSQWSIGSGLEFSFHNAKTTIDNLSDAYATNDGEDDFEFRTSISGYTEKQNVMFINIPLIAQFQTKGTNKFYASGGFKIGIPASKKFTISEAVLKNSGYYSQWGIVMNDQGFMGFGTHKVKDAKEDLDLKVACILALEAGVKWALPNSLALYTGAYFDYGLNDINKGQSKRLIEYNQKNPEEFIHNSVFASKYTDNGKTESLTDRVIPMAIGLKIRLAFGI